MYYGDANNPQKSTNPARNYADTNVRTDHIDYPVRGEGSNAQYDQKRYHVFLVVSNFVRPFIEPGFPFRECKKSGTKGGRNKITQSRPGCNTATSQRKGSYNAPNSTSKDG
jgi:hypothetical protein